MSAPLNPAQREIAEVCVSARIALRIAMREAVGGGNVRLITSKASLLQNSFKALQLVTGLSRSKAEAVLAQIEAEMSVTK